METTCKKKMLTEISREDDSDREISLKSVMLEMY